MEGQQDGSAGYQPEVQTQEKQEARVHETDQVFVSTHRSFGSHMYQAEEVLDQFGRVELHALGDASTLACEIADKLMLNGYGTIVKLTTDTVELEGYEDPSYKDKKTKLLVILEKVTQ